MSYLIKSISRNNTIIYVCVSLRAVFFVKSIVGLFMDIADDRSIVEESDGGDERWP